MRLFWIAPPLAMALLMGCGDLPSLQGIANQTNTVFDPALLGAWNGGDAVAIVRKGENNKYAISWLATNGTAEPQIVKLEATLVQLGSERIVDMTGLEPGPFAIPCHIFLRVRPVKEGLKVQFIDSKWMREKAKSLANFIEDGHPVLTGPSTDVEGFLKKFGFDEKALDEPLIFKRM